MWDVDAIHALRDRWTAERLDGRGELEWILGHSPSTADRERLLDASLRQFLLADGTARLAEQLDRVLATDDFAGSPDTGWALHDTAGPSPYTDTTIARALEQLSDEDIGIATFDGHLLRQAAVRDVEHVRALVVALLEAADGRLHGSRVHDIVSRRVGLPIGIPPLATTVQAPSVDEAARAVLARLAPQHVDALRANPADSDARQIVTAHTAQIALDPDAAAEIVVAVASLATAELTEARDAQPVAVDGLIEVPLRAMDDRREPGRPLRTGEIWSTVAGAAGQRVRVVVVGGASNQGLDPWVPVAVFDGDLDAAGDADLILTPPETTLGVGQRACLDRVRRVPVSALEQRRGRLTREGIQTLDRAYAELLSGDRFGVRQRWADLHSPSAANALSLLDELIEAETPRPGAGAVADDPATVEGNLDQGWSRRVGVHDGVVAVVDLLAGDDAPTVLFDGDIAGAEPVARALRDDGRAGDAVRRLVAAEVRHGDRPFGPWALDSALAAADLDATLPQRSPVVGELLLARTGDALRNLPDDDLLIRALEFARLDTFRADFLGALAPLSAALGGTEHEASFARWRNLVNHATVETTEEFVPEVPHPVGTWADETQRIPVDPLTVVSDVAETNLLLVVAEEEDRSRLRLEIQLRGAVRRALRSEEPHRDVLLVALAPGLDLDQGLWVSLFDTTTGLAVGHCPLTNDGGSLAGSVTRPPEPFGYVIGRHPRRWVGAEPLCAEGLRLAALAGDATANYLTDVGRRFPAQDWRREIVGGLAQSLLGDASTDGPRLPSGVHQSPATMLIRLLRAQRTRSADGLLAAVSAGADDAHIASLAAEVQRLDDLLL